MNSSRDQNEGVHRSGEGGGVLETSRAIIDGMEKNKIKYRNKNRK